MTAEQLHKMVMDIDPEDSSSGFSIVGVNYRNMRKKYKGSERPERG